MERKKPAGSDRITNRRLFEVISEYLTGSADGSRLRVRNPEEILFFDIGLGCQKVTDL